MTTFLTGMNILITAGPTWVPIDRVRVITNVFGGKTGCLIAMQAATYGANVTLLLGPGRSVPSYSDKSLNLIRFKYFKELLQLVSSQTKTLRYDVIIHSAAVADYEPVRYFGGKIRSRKQSLSIKLKPTIKIVDQVKRYDPSIFLVMFKLEIDKTQNQLIDIGFRSLVRAGADLVVANDMNDLTRTLIIDSQKNTFPVKHREDLSVMLLELVSERLKQTKKEIKI